MRKKEKKREIGKLKGHKTAQKKEKKGRIGDSRVFCCKTEPVPWVNIHRASSFYSWKQLKRNQLGFKFLHHLT